MQHMPLPLSLPPFLHPYEILLCTAQSFHPPPKQSRHKLRRLQFLLFMLLLYRCCCRCRCCCHPQNGDDQRNQLRQRNLHFTTGRQADGQRCVGSCSCICEKRVYKFLNAPRPFNSFFSHFYQQNNLTINRIRG